MTFSQDDYARATAIITHAVLTKGIEASYPSLSPREQDEMFITVIDRLARMRGWAIRRESVLIDEGE